MDLENVPGLSEAEQAAVVSYEEAHCLYAVSAMEEFMSSLSCEGRAAKDCVVRSLERIEGAHSRLRELAPAGVPGSRGEMTYEELLILLKERGLGERDGVKPDEPPVLWDELPTARALVFCCLGLMHYKFLTGGALDRVPVFSSKARLYDVPADRRAELGEEGIAGAHGDRNELEFRLWRLLERAVDDSQEERRSKLWAMGNDDGYDARVFVSRYEDVPEYVEGFVEGCLERVREEECEEEMHPDDVTADQIEGLWQDPGLTDEEKREFVVYILQADCQVREDEGDTWRL